MDVDSFDVQAECSLDPSMTATVTKCVPRPKGLPKGFLKINMAYHNKGYFKDYYKGFWDLGLGLRNGDLKMFHLRLSSLVPSPKSLNP